MRSCQPATRRLKRWRVISHVWCCRHNSIQSRYRTMTTVPSQTNQPASKPAKPYKGLAMESVIARWYAHNTKQGQDFQQLAGRLGALLPAGSRVLEVAP